MVHGLARGDNGQVLTVLQLDGFANLVIEIVVLVYIGHGIASHADIYRMRVVHELFHELAGLARVAGQHDLHAGEGAQHGDVVQAVVGSSQRAVSHAAAHAQNFHRLIGVGHVHFHLFQTAGHIETSRAADKYFLAA